MRKYQRNTKKPDLSLIPSDTGLPIINDTYGFTNNIQGMINRKYRKYGSIFCVKAPSLDSIVILGPETAKLLMYPPASTMGRYALEDLEFNGHMISANTPVMTSPVFSYFMEEYWSESYAFDPLRFSQKRAEDKKNLSICSF
jgi:hypothetical protein